VATAPHRWAAARRRAMRRPKCRDYES